MSWNYRVLAHQHKDEITLIITDVYYDKDGVPDGYGDHKNEGGGVRGEIVSGNNHHELINTLDRMKEAVEKPILWAGSKFPQVYDLMKIGIAVDSHKAKSLTEKLIEEGFDNIATSNLSGHEVVIFTVFTTPDKVDHIAKIMRLLNINFNRAN